jgi:hypothetical protein
VVSSSDFQKNIEPTDKALEEWAQGDCVIGEQWFVHRFNLESPLTEVAKKSSEEDSESSLVESEELGLMVVTQTCDIRKPCKKRAFIEVVPIVKVKPGELRQIQSGKRPQFVHIPSLLDKCLVADLDRVMTVEKSVVANWDLVKGCSNENEVRLLGKALARKRTRYAFPDDFHGFIKNLLDLLTKNHEDSGEEGKALQALREIRVKASPDWHHQKIELTFWFIRETDKPISEPDKMAEKWVDLMTASGRFSEVYGQIITLEELNAQDYIDSDRLDLEHISNSTIDY